MADHASDLRGLPRWHPDPLVRETLDRIRRCGWAVTAISDQCSCASTECTAPECSFAYTTGLRLHELPEMAVYGLDARTSGHVLNELGNVFHRYDWRQAVANSVPVQLESLEVPVIVIEMLDKCDLLITNEIYPDAPVLQAVWPDDLGTYPWEVGYSLRPEHQYVKGVHDANALRVDGPRVISAYEGMNRAQRRRAARNWRRG
uniref:DUF4262 domain-containing protein n=1 Tax=Gordonia sp. B7-2 TaxID=3420932 RepID=UPI003D91F213